MSPASEIASDVEDPCLGHNEQLSAMSQNSPDSCLGHKRRLSAASQNSTDSTYGSWSLPNSSKSASPPSSLDSTSHHGGSKSSSRIPSSELPPPASDQSSSQDDEPIAYAVAEVNGARFGYLKIPSNFVPTGWSNDPSHLQIVPNKFPADEYTLQGPILAALASISDHELPRYMISIFSRLYFWTPGSDDLLYVTELYSLTKILGRMNNDSFELQTKPLKPLSQHSPPDQPLHHSLWFWEVPEGWSQSIYDLEYLQEVVLGCYEYGLPLSVPILVSDGRSGSIEFLMKCGEEYYLFFEISSDLVHIDEPTRLHDIVRVLGTERYVGLKTTLVNPLPEYGGPNVVADNDIPEGWSNKIYKKIDFGQVFVEHETFASTLILNKKVDFDQVFFEHGILASTLLLFQNDSLDGMSPYLVQAEAEYYIWSPASNEISRIEKAEGLQDILDILKDPSRHLTLSRIEAGRRSKGQERAVEKDLVMKRKDCKTLPTC